MNQEEIKKIIPHRAPMLLVDEADVIDENTSKGKLTIRGDEFFFAGAFSRQSGCAGCDFV